MDVPEICAELQALQKHQARYLKSRMMIDNHLRATVAGMLGYFGGMTKPERAKKMAEASRLIKKGGAAETHPEVNVIVLSMQPASKACERERKQYEKKMLVLVKQLPVAGWVEEAPQRGFGLWSLAILIGETGDLLNYATVSKVWRRMACAPYTFDGKTQMGGTWRGSKNGKLDAKAWGDFGYSPRRRAIMYLIGENLMKLNFLEGNGERNYETDRPFAGPYRKRYDVKKAEFQEAHPDYKPLRCHLHGMNLASKLLLKNLWIEWRV